jgi:hypothetical protein
MLSDSSSSSIMTAELNEDIDNQSLKQLIKGQKELQKMLFHITSE